MFYAKTCYVLKSVTKPAIVLGAVRKHAIFCARVNKPDKLSYKELPIVCLSFIIVQEYFAMDRSLRGFKLLSLSGVNKLTG